MTEDDATTNDPHAAIRAGGSADPGEPGPGTGISGSTAQLTGELQKTANQALDGLQGLVNHGIDLGEEELVGLLKVAVEAQTRISELTTALSAQVTKAIHGAETEVPELTGIAQASANQTFDGLQGLMNHGFDAGETALVGVLQVADRAQTELTGLLRVLYGTLEQKISGPPKG